MKKKLLFIIAALVLVIVKSLTVSLVAVADDNGVDKGFDRSEDRAAIEQLLKDYAQAADHKDADLWISIWAEDGIYDLSAFNFGSYQGIEQLKWYRDYLIFPSEPLAFSLISNVDVTFTGPETAKGTDNFHHEGYIPIEVDGESNVIKRAFSPFDPSTWDLLTNMTGKLARRTRLGQHYWEVVKVGDDPAEWKISYFEARPLFNAPDEIVSSSNLKQFPNVPWFKDWLADSCSANPFDCECSPWQSWCP